MQKASSFRKQPPVDLAFNWARLALPSEKNFQVPGDGLVQRMASSLFAKVHTLAGRDQLEARFVLKVTSLWPDLSDEERVWAFQSLNVYYIVAALGPPAATAACASSTATTAIVLSPGVILPQQQQGQRRTRRDQQQPAAGDQPAAAPAQATQQRRGKNRRNQPRGGIGEGCR